MGMLVASVDPAITEILGTAGFDYVLLDGEAAPFTVDTVLQHVRAAESRGILPFIRVLENTPATIRRYLDVGCQGIVIPHAETAEDMDNALSATRFAPRGVRGMCPACHGARYSLPGHQAWGSWYDPDSVVVMPIVESRRALANLDQILQVDGIDFLLFGAGDLAQEFGVSASVEQSGPVLDAWYGFVEKVHAHKKYVVATPYPEVSPASVRKLFDQGADSVMHNTDLLVFHETVRQIIAVRDEATS